MAGFDLREGQYIKRNVSDDELWSAFACVFSSRSRNDTSYKFGFLKAILDNIYNVDSNMRLSFDQIFAKFGEIYWNLILKYGLRQKAITNDNRESYLEQVLHTAVRKYGISETVPYEALTMEMMADISHQVKIKCKKYVVGAMYEDTQRLFYSFSKKEEWIEINPVMYRFICKHKIVIEKLNYYEWARFLEKVNEESALVKLLDKLDYCAKRNNLSLYRQILYKEFGSTACFYCGKTLQPDKIDVDHFIPWSFIKDDNLWNLVLACPACNRRKKDKLSADRYLADLIDRNNHILIEMHRPEMKGYRSRMVSYIYNWAKINGYNETWQPKEEKN